MSPAQTSLELLAVVGVHHQDAADALGLAAADVQHARAGVKSAGVDAEVGQLADVRVGHDLERQRREGLAVVGLALRLGLRASPLIGSLPTTGGTSSGEGR